MVDVKRWSGSAWTPINTFDRYTGSVWSPIELKRYNGTGWDVIWPGVSITWTTTADSCQTNKIGTSVDAYYDWDADGTTQKSTAGGGRGAAQSWLSSAPSGDGSPYEMKWVEVSNDGTTYTSMTENTWYDLGSTSRWLGVAGGVGGFNTDTLVADVTIRADSDVGSEVTKRITCVSNVEQ